MGSYYINIIIRRYLLIHAIFIPEFHNLERLSIQHINQGIEI